ncbi:hypothetical protein [Virgibacillus siamensis]|uniref:hypothetical protein n=1 Tax=Virgibacillus siamensis TaxID=480071 RepID=UPI000985A8BB|nr:hypothetical protein [Virgibacillus siamensis]
MIDNRLINKDLENELLDVIKGHIQDGEKPSKIICTLTELLGIATDETFRDFELTEREEDDKI